MDKFSNAFLFPLSFVSLTGPFFPLTISESVATNSSSEFSAMLTVSLIILADSSTKIFLLALIYLATEVSLPVPIESVFPSLHAASKNTGSIEK